MSTSGPKQLPHQVSPSQEAGFLRSSQGLVAPTAMVFVPCIDGISHNEIEDAKPEWITGGGNVLLRAIVEKAGRAS